MSSVKPKVGFEAYHVNGMNTVTTYFFLILLSKINFQNIINIERNKDQLTSIKYDAIMKNPLCVSYKCLSATIHPLFNITLQQG